MAIDNFQIKVQGLDTIQGDFQGNLINEIAKLNEEHFLVSLLIKDPLASMPFLNYASSLGGTEFYKVYNRIQSLPGAIRNKEDIYDATKYDQNMKFRTTTVKIDTRMEVAATFDYWDQAFGNPRTMGELYGNWVRNGLKSILVNFKAQLLELLTGKIKQSPTNGTNYDNTITAVLNTKLGKPNRTEADIRNDYDSIFRTVDRLARTPNEEDFIVSREDYAILVSPLGLLNLSKALERYTGATVTAWKEGRPLAMTVAGLKIYAEELLDTYGAFSGNAKIHKTKTYDFSDIDCVIVHKRAVFPKIWTFGQVFTWQTAGQIFSTMKAGWGLYDGLVRPKQVAYFTQKATKSTSRTV